MRHEINPPQADTFSQRKKDHIDISMQAGSQSLSDQFARLHLQHKAIPEIDFEDVSLSCEVFGHSVRSPLFVSSMTLGHDGASSINQTIIKVCAEKGWMMGVGSQRRQLFDPEAWKECQVLREQFPEVILFGNIGLSQLITSPTHQIEELVQSLNAQFLVVHTNPLQEAIQSEGTPQFRGGLQALSRVCEELSVPVVLKETGCGFSKETFKSIRGVGLAAVDVSGRGGTHWGRVEGLRNQPESMNYKVAQTFADWGLDTVDSLENGVDSGIACEMWASGGVRTGLEAAKLIALGARKVGYAQPILQAALNGEQDLHNKMTQLDEELKVAMFCLGIETVDGLVGKRNLLRWT